jgi:hypothetical protein
MDLSRRGFLETLGLAGLSLTLPKPLKVMAARMADLEKPPLHVGYCEVASVPEGGVFLMYGFGVNFLSLPSIEIHNDYMNNWVVSVFLKEKDKQERILYVQRPARCVPEARTGMMTVLANPHPMVVSPNSVMEFWWTPEGKPRFPLPELRLYVRGARSFGYKQSSRIEWHGLKESMQWVEERKVKHVCLERSRAIELGLVGPEEPEFRL